MVIKKRRNLNATNNNEAITFDTYMFRYNPSEDVISTEPFLFDSLTVTRALPDWAEYDAVIASAETFIGGDFGNYTDESVAAAVAVVSGALNEKRLDSGSAQTKQDVIDEATNTIKAALEEAKNALTARLVSVTPEASVVKLSGNQNELTIRITVLYADGSTEENAMTTKINNNSAGSYDVGEYKVFVDTKGNDQIRACYIIE